MHFIVEHKKLVRNTTYIFLTLLSLYFHVTDSDLISACLFLFAYTTLLSESAWCTNIARHSNKEDVLDTIQSIEYQSINSNKSGNSTAIYKNTEHEHQMYREILFGKLSSSFFHDLITPLNTIHILLTTPQENPASVIRKCKESSEKINFYIHRYRELIKNPENSEWFNIQREIGHVATLLKTTAQVHNIDIIEQTESSIIYGNKSIFVQIIANIVSNAIDSHKENNTVNKRITIRAKKDRSKIKIIIKDNGKGIPEHLLRNIFEYSFTTKQNLGCGIGLSYVKEHLKKFYSGHISCTSKENKGTTFQIHFPIHPGGHATSRDVQSGDDHTHEHRTNEFLF